MMRLALIVRDVAITQMVDLHDGATVETVESVAGVSSRAVFVPASKLTVMSCDAAIMATPLWTQVCCRRRHQPSALTACDAAGAVCIPCSRL